MKNNIKKSPPSKGKAKIQHAFRGIRESVMSNALDNTVLSTQVNPSTTSVTGSIILSPQGIYAAPLSVSGSNVIVGPTLQAINNPSLRWLYNTSGNFGKYRVTRATLVFVGNQGSTMTGTMVVTAFRDVYDASAVTQNAFATGPNAKTFDLASSSTKEIRIPVPVDTSWKKVSKTLNTNLTTPFQNSAQNILLSVNSVNDISFGAFSFNAVGTPSSSQGYSLGSFFLDYDVEFGEPQSFALNF